MSQIFLSPFAMPELDRVVEQLCAPSSLEGVFHRPLHDAPMPSLDVLEEILSRLKIALFPGYFGMSNVRMESMRYHLSANLDSIFRKLAEQIRCGACFACAEYAQECLECERISREKALEFIERLPHIRWRSFATRDAVSFIRATLPAATSAGETIFCYPSILTMIHYRIAHELYLLEVPIIPRILCEMAHAITGIDIHPGASVGEAFFIDHGTGVVIGETCVIGRGCRLYQGVTLGALSFPKGADGVLIKGIPRHPKLEDGVTVGATILGNITIEVDLISARNTLGHGDAAPQQQSRSRMTWKTRTASACCCPRAAALPQASRAASVGPCRARRASGMVPYFAVSYTIVDLYAGTATPGSLLLFALIALLLRAGRAWRSARRPPCSPTARPSLLKGIRTGHRGKLSRNAAGQRDRDPLGKLKTLIV